MTTRTAWIHVGTDKTGSTTLQQYFNENRELFSKELNLHYAPGANHAALPLPYLSAPANYPYFKNRGISDKAQIESQTATEQRNLDNWLKSQPSGDVLFSFEGLIHLQPDEFHALLANLKLQGFSRVVGIYYARAHCGYACSAISQRVKMGKLPLEGLHVPALDHAKILSSLRSVFSKENLIVRPFTTKLFPDNDLIQDFIINCLGIKTHDRLKETKLIARQNESLSLFGIQLGSKIIERLTLLNVAVPPAAFNNEIGTLLGYFPGPKFELSQLSQQLLYKQTRDISKWMQREFNIDLDDFSLLGEGTAEPSKTKQLSAAQILLADSLANFAADALQAR